MGKKIKLIILCISILSTVILGIILIMITSKRDSENEKDNIYNGSIVESTPTEKLVIPLTEYNEVTFNPPGILLDYYEGWERVKIEVIRGTINLDKIKGPGFALVNVGNKYELNKDNPEEIHLRSGVELYETYEGDRIFYAYVTFFEDEHIVAQSFVVIREDMEETMNQVYDGLPTNYYATPIKEVQYKKIEGKYQNVTKDYADAWFNNNMEEYEIKKAVETVPEKSRFKITECYSAEYTKSGNDERIYSLNGISIEYELQNSNQYVDSETDNGKVILINEYSDIKINSKSNSSIGTSMRCWYDSENFEKDKYDDRVAYLKLKYKENLRVLGLALIKIDYKDDTKTSYTTKIKEVAYEPIDGRGQYVTIFMEEAWFERAISEFEQETTP